MDNQAGIEKNVEALKRILVSLVAMAGLGQNTLPRHLHRAILRLLRPAESAARRLIIAMALTSSAREQANVVTASPWRGPTQKAEARRVRHFQPKMPPQPAARPALRRLALPLIDPLQHPFRRATVRQASIPRLWIFGMTSPRLAGSARPTQDDALDATRLRLRLDALALALDDLPRQAMRFARWRARQACRRQRGVACLRWPLRPGRPPGSYPRDGRQAHEVHAVLAHAHALGWWALKQRADTS